MKKLSKIVALLLAGALTMLLFTACGGGGGGSFGQRMPDDEKEAFKNFTSKAQASNVTENDKSLQAVADGYLQKDLNSSVEFFWRKAGRQSPCGWQGSGIPDHHSDRTV